MQLEVGKIYDGKVTGITKFGAFVELDAKITGMVHISEVANTFVSEIKDHLTEGQAVKVKVLAVNDDGKISLSIKKALPPPPRRNDAPGAGAARPAPRPGGFSRPPQTGARPPMAPSQGGGFGNFGKRRAPAQFDKEASGDASFEDMLNRFKQTSEEKFSDLKRVIDNKRKGGSRRGK
ncbi:MAG: S1 RNA-binding domain-containing protein [Oscillospiraceae bacterium]